MRNSIFSTGREIKNVFVEMPENSCFACHPENKIGLKLKFFADDEKGEVYTLIRPQECFSGFPGILHGGIQCTLLDEVAFWTMFDRVGKIGLTTKVEIEYLKVAEIGRTLEVRGKVLKVKGRVVVVESTIVDGKSEVCTKGKISYFLPTKDVLFSVIGEDKFGNELIQYIKD